MAVMLITHAMGVIAETAQRVVVMYAGQVIEQAPVAELFASPRHPYTQGLIRSIPRIDQPRGQLPTLPGAPPDMSALPTGCRFRDRCAFAQERCKTHPELLEVAPGHLSRCWVAQDGISLADAPATNPELADAL